MEAGGADYRKDVRSTPGFAREDQEMVCRFHGRDLWYGAGQGNR